MDLFWPEVSLAIVAEYSKPVSIAVILGCFMCMAIFIIRLNINGKVEIKPGENIPGQAMRGVHNPYSVKLCSSQKSSLKDGVWLEVYSNAPCILQAFWGVSIAELYPNIYIPWTNFEQQLDADIWLKDNISHRGEKIRYDVCEKRKLKLEVPLDAELSLGDLPRRKYPLVVVLLNDPDIGQLQNTCVASHISIFHLQDLQCPGKSHIISQYIRTPLGLPCQLQPLYVAAADDDLPPASTNDTDSGGIEADGLESSSNRCVVCQTETINRALLPCRHTCVCDSCFVHLAKCPMCRSPIVSYFQLTPTEDNPWTDEEEDPMDLPWWERWNNRINAFFGFT